MAYQPKYAAKGKTNTSPSRMSVQTQVPRETAQPTPRKETISAPRSKGALVIRILLTLVIVPVSIFLTAILLSGIFENVGTPKPANQAKVTDRQIVAELDSYMEQQMDAIRSSLTGPQTGGQTVSTPGNGSQATETPVVRELYTIPADAQVAPEPNQNFFGEAEDPSTLQWLLDEAAWMLEGQQLYFNTDIEIYADSKVRYYLDDSIFAVTWKEVHENTVYTYAEVKVRDASQFRRHLAGGEFGSDIQYFTTEMAETVNAVVASAGDFHRFRDFGICVYEGQVKKVEGTYAETCMIDRSGNMKFVYGGELTKTAQSQAYVDENDIQFSLCFGPVLVDNYEIKEHTWYGVGEINEGYARSALCQMGDLHYLVMTANVEGVHQDLHSVATFQKYVAQTGCRMAYCLDGGQTATIVMNDELVNRPAFGTQRKISDIIYFATAIPEGG